MEEKKTMSEDKKIEKTSSELNDEALDRVSGGVQAGLITKGGRGEFGDTKPKKEEETEEQRHRRLMLELEGKSYL